MVAKATGIAPLGAPEVDRPRNPQCGMGLSGQQIYNRPPAERSAGQAPLTTCAQHHSEPRSPATRGHRPMPFVAPGTSICPLRWPGAAVLDHGANRTTVGVTDRVAPRTRRLSAGTPPQPPRDVWCTANPAVQGDGGRVGTRWRWEPAPMEMATTATTAGTVAPAHWTRLAQPGRVPPSGRYLAIHADRRWEGSTMAVTAATRPSGMGRVDMRATWRPSAAPWASKSRHARQPAR